MPLSPPFITALTAGILVIIQMALLYSVVRARRRNRQSLGDGGKDDMMLAIRRHGNFAENAAIFISGFAILELIGGSSVALAVMCAAFVLARASHAVGLSIRARTVNRFRIGGTAATVLVGVALGVRLVLVALPHLAL